MKQIIAPLDHLLPIALPTVFANYQIEFIGKVANHVH